MKTQKMSYRKASTSSTVDTCQGASGDTGPGKNTEQTNHMALQGEHMRGSPGGCPRGLCGGRQEGGGSP